MEDLLRVVRTYPILDNHAHNLLQHDQNKSYPLLSMTTEASGEALKDTPRSLPHLRAARQLKELYACDSSDWETISAQHVKAIEDDADSLIRKCFEGVHSILIDDGLDKDTVESYDWHKQYVPGVVRRIVRLEAIAEDIMRTEIGPAYKHAMASSTVNESSVSLDEVEKLWSDFYQSFEHALDDAIADPEVCGFKSVVCYRTGLAIPPAKSGAAGEPPPEDVILNYFENATTNDSFRFESKPLNDWLVNFTLFKLSLAYHENAVKPIQFHTGLGDNDINLILSDPAHLQPLIEHYDEVPFIILHSSYPYTRQAGYLATVYPNAFLDIGEVFPMVSRDGQEHIIREALEMVPGNKLLYSSDGHWFPETYWLANKQFRSALEKVLVEYVREDDLTLAEATQLAQDILFHNSNRIYALDLELDVSEVLAPPRSLTPLPTRHTQDSYSTPTETTLANSRTAYNIQLFHDFEAQHPDLGYIYLQWLDYMGQMRTRMMPIKSFRKLLEIDGSVGISRGNTGTLQDDSETAAMTPIGQIYVRPMLESLRLTHDGDKLRQMNKDGKVRPSAMVMGSFYDDKQNVLPGDPRGRVVHMLDILKQEYSLDITLGFEIEVVFLRRLEDHTWVPVTQSHAWSTLSDEQYRSLDLLTDCVDALSDCGIDVQQFHAESAPGQYEFILDPTPALSAIDTLVQARKVLQQVASLRGLRATLHPQPFPGIGTAAHCHFSGSRATGTGSTGELADIEQQMSQFVAGALDHLPSICAYTLPSTVSYTRVAPSGWMGGTWVSWGTQNRECPIRRINDVHWELRCLDGLANPYFAVASLLCAGVIGLRHSADLGRWRDCQVDLAKVGDEEREKLGVVTSLPRNLEASLNALRRDQALRDGLGDIVVDDYVMMKEKETQVLMNMDETRRRDWIIERY
jgi:glutamine synthetase